MEFGAWLNETSYCNIWLPGKSPGKLVSSRILDLRLCHTDLGGLGIWSENLDFLAASEQCWYSWSGDHCVSGRASLWLCGVQNQEFGAWTLSPSETQLTVSSFVFLTLTGLWPCPQLGGALRKRSNQATIASRNYISYYLCVLYGLNHGTSYLSKAMQSLLTGVLDANLSKATCPYLVKFWFYSGCYLQKQFQRKVFQDLGQYPSRIPVSTLVKGGNDSTHQSIGTPSM